jgi:hypothetical protein
MIPAACREGMINKKGSEQRETPSGKTRKQNTASHMRKYKYLFKYTSEMFYLQFFTFLNDLHADVFLKF